MTRSFFRAARLASLLLLCAGAVSAVSAADDAWQLINCVQAWSRAPRGCSTDNLATIYANGVKCFDLIQRNRGAIQYTDEPRPGGRPIQRCAVGTAPKPAETSKTLEECVAALGACNDGGLQLLEPGCQVKIREALKKTAGSALVRNDSDTPWCRLGSRESAGKNCLQDLFKKDAECKPSSIEGLESCKADLTARLAGNKRLNPGEGTCVVVDASQSKCAAHPISQSLLEAATAAEKQRIAELGEALGDKCAQLASFKATLEQRATLKKQCADLNAGLAPTNGPRDLRMQCVRLAEQDLRQRSQNLGLDQAACDELARTGALRRAPKDDPKAMVCADLAKRKSSAKPADALEMWQSECDRLTEGVRNKTAQERDRRAACTTRDRIAADIKRLHPEIISGDKLHETLSRFQQGAAPLSAYERDLLGTHLSTPYQRKALESQCRNAASQTCKNFIAASLLEARATARVNGYYGSDPKAQAEKRLINNYLARSPDRRFLADFDKCSSELGLDRACADKVIAGIKRRLAQPSAQTIQLCSNVPPGEAELYAACRRHLQDVVRQTPNHETLSRPVPDLVSAPASTRRPSRADYQSRVASYQRVCTDPISILFNPQTCWGGAPSR